jgi:hypothetical protein
VSDDKKVLPIIASMDLETLPGEFRMFRAEMRTQMELLLQKLIQIVDRIEPEIDDLKVRTTRLERERIEDARRITALEQADLTRRKAARKRK